ncbi:AsmA family protein [Polynucleobacter sinensis]|jgi:uncharacterized protein involved in outer membrane biogenesis|uniref:AsmA family protein n=1 Tax=Polynucleobacter sinensis TaxID=1743157 RepID=UPI0007835ED1|nr:AsmA family protein [Polynucleobacter sinensis]
MNKKLKVIAAILGGFILLSGAGIWYAASRINPAELTKLLSDSVKTTTGRDLKITGPVSLELFPKISVSANQLSLSNASWADSADMLTLKHIDLDLKLLPLFSGQVEIGSIKLSGLELFLQKNAAGLANWDLSLSPASSDSAKAVAPVDSTSNTSNFLSIGDVSILDAKIHYRDVGSPVSIYQVKRLSVAQSADKASILLNMQYQGLPIEVAGKTGSISQALKQWDVAPVGMMVDLNVSVNGKSILMKGDIKKQPKSDLLINLALTSKSFDWPSFDSAPQTLAKTSANSQANTQSQTQKTGAARRPNSQYLFSDDALPFDALPRAKGTISLDIAELGLPSRRPIQNLSATVNMDAATIDIPHLLFQLGKGRADIQFSLSRPVGASPTLLLKGVTKDFTLEDLMARLDPRSKVSGGNMKLAFDIKASGKSLHQLASSSNGKIQVSIQQAKMGSNVLNDAGDFVVTVLDSMNPLRKKSKETILECMVAYLPINNGQININNTVGGETDRLNAVLSGSINLKTEAVNLTIDPREKSGLTTGLDLAGLVKIGGTLSNPKAGVNQAGVVNSAVSIGLGILTGGASLLAENAKSLATKAQPCRDALRPWADIYPGAE